MEAALCFLLTLATPAYANASWDYIVTRPLLLLPVLVAATLALELWIIGRRAGANSRSRVFTAVLLANLLSYLAPKWRVFSQWDRWAYTRTPFYAVTLGYLLLTLLVELPVVYLLLRGRTDDRPRLAGAIVLANGATTLLCLLAERVFMRLLYNTYL